MWIRGDNAFTPIIDLDFFYAAQRLLQERNRHFSSDEMLETLRRLLKEHGWLSGLVIDESEGTPSSSAYRTRFGSLVRAYQMIGYSPGRDYRYLEINRMLRSMHPDIVAGVVRSIEQLGGAVAIDPLTDLITINGEFTASIVLARCFSTGAGRSRWKIRIDTGLKPDITVAVRMDTPNEQVLDYYLFPRLDVPGAKVRLGEENGIFIDTYRFDSLGFFFDLATRTRIEVAA